MITAAEKASAGAKYIIAGEFKTMEEIAKTLAEVTGKPEPKIRFPYPAIWSFAVVQELYSRLSGKPALVTRTAINTMRARLNHDSSKAIRELGVEFRPFIDTLRSEVEWFRTNNYLTEKNS